jgi:hypothetical protein
MRTLSIAGFPRNGWSEPGDEACGTIVILREFSYHNL